MVLPDAVALRFALLSARAQTCQLRAADLARQHAAAQAEGQRHATEQRALVAAHGLAIDPLTGDLTLDGLAVGIVTEPSADHPLGTVVDAATGAALPPKLALVPPAAGVQG